MWVGGAFISIGMIRRSRGCLLPAIISSSSCAISLTFSEKSSDVCLIFARGMRRSEGGDRLGGEDGGV